MTTPKVNSPSLAQTLKSIGSRVEQYTETLDAISEDIKSVERWLRDSGVRLEVEIVYRDSAYVTDPSASVGVGSLDIAGPFRGRRDSATVSWGPTDSGNSWRLLHRVRVEEGTWEEGEWCWDSPEPEVVDTRPLIETTAQIRLGLGDALEKLVEEIASKIPAYTQETLIEGDLHAFDRSIPESGTGPWRVRFQTGTNPESTTGQRLYETWTDVLDAVARLTDASPEDLTKHLNGYSFTLQRLKVPVRVLRELKLM